MKRIFVSCLVFSLVAFASSAMAGVKAGMWEASAQLQYDNADVDIHESGAPGVDMSSLLLAGKLAYFFTNNIALGATVSGMNTEVEIEDVTLEASMYMFGIEPSFYINTDSNIVPYIGLNGGWINWDVDIEGTGDDGNDYFYGAQIGVLTFLNDWAAFDFQGRYTRYQLEIDSTDIDIDDFSFRVGINIYF